METTLEQYQREALENSKAVVVDLSDTTIKGNASYGAFGTIWDKLKEGKFLDALKLGAHGLKIYTRSRLRRFSDLSDWDFENYLLEDLHQCLDKYGVKRGEMKKWAGRYIKFFENPGAKNFLDRIRNFGENKKVILLTRESSECAEAAEGHFGFDSCISNITRLRPNGIINDVQIIMKGPEYKLSLLQEELEKDGIRLEDVVMISDNPEDPYIFKGKVGLFATYNNGKGEINIDDYRKFEKQLINPD
ncbi:MAG: hypothetical protein GTN36_02425 [Candidatus Aenigmarchaeota archaeon]|nr:hypothetical protein [Candidatus Aenigmarchaeota archaeon]